MEGAAYLSTTAQPLPLGRAVGEEACGRMGDSLIQIAFSSKIETVWNFILIDFVKVAELKINPHHEPVCLQYPDCKRPAKQRLKQKRPPVSAHLQDGGWALVRSRGEAMIDDWLYRHKIAHAYEPLLTSLRIEFRL